MTVGMDMEIIMVMDFLIITIMTITATTDIIMASHIMEVMPMDTRTTIITHDTIDITGTTPTTIAMVDEQHMLRIPEVPAVLPQQSIGDHLLLQDQTMVQGLQELEEV